MRPRGLRAWFAGLLLVTLLTPGEARTQSLRPEEIYQKLVPSVMTLRVENARGETYVGTAFLALDKNVAVTAWHVVSDAVKVSARFSDDRVVEVTKLIDKDETHDLALVRLDAAGRSSVALNLASPSVGSRVYVIRRAQGF